MLLVLMEALVVEVVRANKLLRVELELLVRVIMVDLVLEHLVQLVLVVVVVALLP
jgi:hypothetical protein